MMFYDIKPKELACGRTFESCSSCFYLFHFSLLHLSSVASLLYVSCYVSCAVHKCHKCECKRRLNVNTVVLRVSIK